MFKLITLTIIVGGILWLSGPFDCARAPLDTSEVENAFENADAKTRLMLTRALVSAKSGQREYGVSLLQNLMESSISSSQKNALADLVVQVESDVSRLNGTETPTNRIVENSFLGRLQARSDDYRTRTRLWLALRKQETEAKLGPRWHQFTATISQSLHRAKQKILGWTESVK